MSDIFDAQIDITIGEEGGYTNDPADHGGETNWGITVAEARAYGYAGPMQQMPRDFAVSVYRKKYVAYPQWDHLAAIDQPLALRLFDIGVNMGPVAAGKFVQRALNVLNMRGSLYPTLILDGFVWEMGRAALAAFYAYRPDGPKVMLSMVAAQQSVRYIEIAEGEISQEDFEFGWQDARVANIQTATGTPT